MLPFTLQQLRILKAVSTEKNFTKAAELFEKQKDDMLILHNEYQLYRFNSQFDLIEKQRYNYLS